MTRLPHAPRRSWTTAGSVLALLALALIVAPEVPAAGARHGPLLLQPLRELGAQLLWIRFQQARLSGAGVRALDLAERALDLDPASTAGWQALADHLALDLASREREPDRGRRRALFESAQEVLRRGRARARDPGALDLTRALLCLVKADGDPELHPAGRGGLLQDAAQAFERAAEAGHPEALELARLTRAEGQR